MLLKYTLVCLKLYIDMRYPWATKDMEFLYHGYVSTQHATQYIMFLLQPRGLRVWETNSWLKHSTLSVLQCAITIQETWVCLKCPLQSVWHVKLNVSQRQVASYNPFRLCPAIKLNYTSRLPVVFSIYWRNGTLTVICRLQTEINPWKLCNMFFFSYTWFIFMFESIRWTPCCCRIIGARLKDLILESSELSVCRVMRLWVEAPLLSVCHQLMSALTDVWSDHSRGQTNWRPPLCCHFTKEYCANAKRQERVNKTVFAQKSKFNPGLVSGTF